MKKGISIGIGIAIAVIVIVFAASWFVGNESSNNSQPPPLPTTNATVPVGHTYHLNFTESVGIHAHP